MCLQGCLINYLFIFQNDFMRCNEFIKSLFMVLPYNQLLIGKGIGENQIIIGVIHFFINVFQIDNKAFMRHHDSLTYAGEFGRKR